MKSGQRAIAALFVSVILHPASGHGQGVPRSRLSSAVDAELLRSRTEVLQKTKETRVGAEKLLALHQAELKHVIAEYEKRRELYAQGLIARNDVVQAEYRVARTTSRVEDDKRFLAETDSALTEFTMRDELLRLPNLAVGGYSETNNLLRFNGVAGFTLAEVAKIERFFTSTFGHSLPISALGQTATHNRMRFDHHNAVDVALHPESAEGHSVINYLRQAGIPFIAFRGAVPGAATGAHIHIGKPSPRM